MVETDWREILNFSQHELGPADKEKLSESISWMEADDIELNFSDLKTLFRLAQDIIKYKSEQVNNLLGKLEAVNRKDRTKKGKTKSPPSESPASTDSMLETIAHQEEVIKANKEILQQLYTEITELKGKKGKLEQEGSNLERESNSSRDALSEMETVVQLENEVAMKNKHIRKLLSDVKVIEDENSKLKEKVPVLKDKLLEATQLIDNLTGQLLSVNDNCSQLKDLLGKSEKVKAELCYQIESLRKELFQKDSNRENIYHEVKSKAQHWKNLAKAKKSELEVIAVENEKLKQNLAQISQQLTISPKTNKNTSEQEELKIKELQEKLNEASNEIEQSANLITLLRTDNRRLKGILEDRDTPESAIADNRNESDDGKLRIIISKLKKKIRSLTVAFQEAEERVAVREQELAEIASELQLLQSDEGINGLLQELKHKKRELRVREEGMKSLIQEVNNMNQLVSDLQLENETLRQKYNIPANESVSTDKIVQKYRDLEQNNTDLCKETRLLENKLVNVQLNNRYLGRKLLKLKNILLSSGHSPSNLEYILQNDVDMEDDIVPVDGERGSTTCFANHVDIPKEIVEQPIENLNSDQEEMDKLAEENEGLRKGLQEILDFLKDNSTTSSGILALQCPSLEALLRSMESRHAAGWFAPHMATIMELRAAIGGKDALLIALHEARKETFDLMTQFSKETKKSSELERKLEEVENTNRQKKSNDEPPVQIIHEFGTWISEKDQNDINPNNTAEIENMLEKGNIVYESQLKKSLEYFHEKFKTLYDKISLMAIQAADDNNKWLIQEEQYRAQIENLKWQIQQQEDDDASDNSPGMISPVPNITHLQRKCSYLEDSYKYIRTLNENIKNENMDAKRQIMTISTEYETEIQRLVISITYLTDKLRNSIPIELFWKLNLAYNEINMKYRKTVEEAIKIKKVPDDLQKKLDDNKLDIINNIQKFVLNSENEQNNTDQVLSSIGDSVFKKQIEVLCKEIDDKTKIIEHLEKRNAIMQEDQSKIIDDSLATITLKELNLIKIQLENLAHENKALKEQCRYTESQSNISILQLQENQQRQLGNDMEVNLLRHQILDLQASSDNKAIVARLSGEVLVAHLQASECNKKIEQLNSALNKEKELRIDAEEMFKARQKIFDVYAFRYESKFRYIFEVMQVLRQQYQGSIPLSSIESYLNNIEYNSRETRVIYEKLQDIEDLRSNLMAKHSVYDQILDVSRNKCYIENNSCSHKLKAVMMESMHSRELDHVTTKLKIMEQSREELINHCNNLEKTLLLLNQAFDKSPQKVFTSRKHSDGEINVSLELEDVHSDDDSSRKSQTVTLPKPQILKSKATENKNGNNKNDAKKRKEGPTYAKEPIEDNNIISTPVKNQTKIKPVISLFSTQTQTPSFDKEITSTTTQTMNDQEYEKLKQKHLSLQKDYERNYKELGEALLVVQQRHEENLVLSSEKINIESNVRFLQTTCAQKEKIIESMRFDIEELKNELGCFRNKQITEINKKKDIKTAENKSLLLALQQMENDKNMIAAEYKELLDNEREEYSNTIRDLNVKVMELQSKLDRKGSDSIATNGEALKGVVNKYTVKIVELEDKSFKLQGELDECRAEVTTYQSEVDRWKELATERLVKMEQLNSQLAERHCHEVESYKQENQHWLSQLNDTQREHMELRTRLTEQKALYLKQLADKDGQIEQMRSVINNLKTQIMNMQTMISVHDPSFDLSAIVEVEEASDGISQQGSDRLEIKFDSSGELNDICEEYGGIGSSSTSIWQEPVIERLRRDKQLVGKQNAILRRQIKALAARERRSRLDAQNLKNQVFRISSSGSRVATAESAALHNKIAMLQAQLSSARRDTHSSIALWDKWKRAQQSADRWQARYEDKCQEVKKLEASVQLAKSAVSRLEREKRGLLSRLSELKGETLLSLEKQDRESPEKSQRSIECTNCIDGPALSNRTLLERVQAQQRRIVALTLAEKGNEHLVSEYEKALAEVTSLKGQVLKLESALLEAQIRTPLSPTTPDPQPELHYWKSYCEMLKEENVQLNMRVSSIEAVPSSAPAHTHRINDLEQTVLTLRGLVSKLQSEQKSSSSIVSKRIDSRPSSGRSVQTRPLSKSSPSSQRSDMNGIIYIGPTRLESHRIEIVNLKKSIQDKDLLLERSKEMLKIAAEREDELLQENAYLRRQLNDQVKPKGGFLSA